LSALSNDSFSFSLMPGRKAPSRYGEALVRFRHRSASTQVEKTPP
jgi:hypothetical protein